MTIRSLDPLTCFGLLSTDDLLWEEFCHQEFVDAVHERGDGDGEEEGEGADSNVYRCRMPASCQKQLFERKCMTLNRRVN